MRLTLIKPRIFENFINQERLLNFSVIAQPLALAVLAGLTPDDVEIKCYDDRIEPIPYDEPTDVVGITVDTISAKRAYQISAEFRKRNVPIVMGGIHPTIVPQESILHCDAVVIGEAEAAWGEVIKHARDKKLKKFYGSRARAPLQGIQPDRSIFDGKKYFPLYPVEVGRGCAHRCNFCVVSAFFSHTYVARPVQDVLQDLRGLKKRLIFFTDDNIIADPNRAKDFFRAIIPLKIKWMGQSTISLAKDDELMELMSESGCQRLIIGLESVIPQTLKNMHKLPNIAIGDYAAALDRIRAHRISVCGSFLFGYGAEPANILEQTVLFALQNKLFNAYFNFLVPYPETPFYEEMLSTGKLRHPHWWLDEECLEGKPAFALDGDQSKESILALGQRSNRMFYTVSSIIKRMERSANCRGAHQIFDYLVSNFFYARRHLF